MPSLQWLTDLGYKRYQIAEAVQLDESRVREIFRDASLDGKSLVHIVREPVKLIELDPRYQAMMEFTGEAFQAFCEEFSEYDTMPQHQRLWAQAFIDNPNVMLNVPPRHGKSWVFSIWLPIWLLCRNRDEQILIVSKTGSLATRFVREIAQNFEQNHHLIEVFGRFAPERKGESVWKPSGGQLSILGRSLGRGASLSVLGLGSGQQVLGFEATVIICDDPTDPATTQSETENERRFDWFREEVLSRLETKIRGEAANRCVVVGQRIAFNDLYGQVAALNYELGELAGQPVFPCITFPAVLDWDKKITLWPENFDYETLMVTHGRLGSRKFATLFQQDPLPAGDRVFRPEFWEMNRQHDRNGGQGYRVADSEFLPIARVVSLDPSPSKYNGLVVADVVYNRLNFACAIIEAQHYVGGMRDTLKRLNDAITIYRPDYCIIEYSTYVHWLKEDPIFEELSLRTRFLGHHTGSNKGDPDLGVESLGADQEAGRLLLPYGDAWGREMSMLLESEANAFPQGNTNDVLMALWFIKFNYKKLIPASVYQDLGGGMKNIPPRLKNGWSWIPKAAAESRKERASKELWRNQLP
jgi:hypothetical protein